jgi:hypothetical protein
MQQQQGARDLSREALARAAAPIDASSLFAEVMAPQAGFGDFSQPAAAAAAPAAPAAGVGSSGFNIVMEKLLAITERLDQQAVPRVVAPSLPASVTTTAAQETGKAVASMAQNMLASESGEYLLGLGRMGFGFLGWEGKQPVCCRYCFAYAVLGWPRFMTVSI